jgi:hypothetical protein
MAIPFYDIEKMYLKKYNNNIDTKQLEFEFNYYLQAFNTNKDLFKTIQKLIYKNIHTNSNILKLESMQLNNLLEICKNINKNINNDFNCELFLSQLITNWFLLSFTNKIYSTSFEVTNYIYTNRYDLLESVLDYMNKFVIYYNNDNNELYINQTKCKKLITSFISLLCIEKIFVKTTLNKYVNGTKKSHILIGLKIQLKTDILYNTKLYLNEPNIIHKKNNKYFIGLHYSTITTIFKKNIKSDKIFQLKDNNFLKNIKGIKYNINTEMYTRIVKELEKEFNCDKISLVKNIKCKIKNILDDDKSTKKIINDRMLLKKYKKSELNLTSDLIDDDIDTPKFELEDLLEDVVTLQDNYDSYYYNETTNIKDVNLENDDDFTNKIKNHFIINVYNNQKSCLNKYYNYLVFLSLENIFKDITYFYLTYALDFRGRVYSNSFISPMGNKLFRYIYTYGEYLKEDIEKVDLYLQTNIKDIILQSNLIKNINIDIKNEIKMKYIYWILFELGKLFKSDILEINKGILDDQIILKHGDYIYDLYKKNKLKLSFNELLELYHIDCIINSLNKNIFIKYIIYKDSTASGIQLLLVVLGAINNDIYKICNLDSTSQWYDTYYHIIEMFKNTPEIKNLFILNNPILQKILNRKILKRLTMVYGYNVSYAKGKDYYINDVKNNVTEIEKLDSNLQVSILVFTLYFNFLNSLFKKGKFFKKSLENFVKEYKEMLDEKGIVQLEVADKSIISLEYNYMISIQVDRTYKKKRTRIKICKPSEEINKTKTIRALVANATHALDANYVRYILTELDYPIITIHDCFGIDILSIDILLKIANNSINKICYTTKNPSIPDKKYFYSKYILI